MKNKKFVRFFTCFLACMALAVLFAIPAAADEVNNVAGVVEKTWADVESQAKAIVDNVVFPVLDMILAVAFFVKIGMAYFDYKKHGQFEWTGPVILFACLIFSLTAPLYIWDIIS